jgi:hypothetical protein
MLASEVKFKPHLPTMSERSRRGRGEVVPAFLSFLLLAPAAVLGLMMLAVGGLPPTVTLVAALACALVLGLASLPRGQASWRAPFVVVPFVFLAAYTLLQCIPLPPGLLGTISPHAADVWARSLAPLGPLAQPHAVPLSLAPESTLVEAVKWMMYAALAWLGHAWGRTKGLEAVCQVMLVLGLLAAFVTVMHGVLHLTAVFGLYTPANMYQRWRVGPLLNVNHLSAYLALGIFGGLALLLSNTEAPSARTALQAAGTTALVVGVVVLASRAGVASLAIGALLLPLAIQQPGKRRRDSSSRPRRTAVALTATAIIAGGAFAIFGYREGILEGLGEKNWTKIQVLRDAVPMVRDYWLTGLGRGAFEGPFFAYKSIGNHESWGHPENLAVQWLTEWGMPVTVVGAGLLLVAILRSSGWRTGVTARVLLLGLIMLGVHNLLDYSLEVPAVAGLAVWVFGAVCGTQGSSTAPRPEGKRLSSGRAKQLALATSAALALLAVAGLRRGPERLSDLRARAYAVLQESRTNPAIGVDAFVDWSGRFPAEPYFPLAAAVVASRQQPLGGLPWFNRALELSPNTSDTHLLLAESLARAGLRSQAMLELRLWLARDPSGTGAATTLASLVARTADEVIAIAPEPDKRSLAFLESVARQLPPGSPITPGLRQHILDKRPCSLTIHEANARDLLSRMAAKEAPCEGEKGRTACGQLIEPSIAQLRVCPEGEGLAQRLRADLLWLTDDQAGSLSLLEQSCGTQLGELTPCLQLVAERAAALHDGERVRRHVRVVVSRRCQGTEACGSAWLWASRVYTIAGDPGSAFVAATKASEVDPASIELRRELAEAALRAGARDKAELTLNQILSRKPDDAQARARLEQIRAMPAAIRAPATASAPAPGRPPPGAGDRGRLRAREPDDNAPPR